MNSLFGFIGFLFIGLFLVGIIKQTGWFNKWLDLHFSL
jgi:hypothetical protein